MLLILVVSTAVIISSEIVLLLVVVVGSVEVAEGVAVCGGVGTAETLPAVGLMSHLHL